MRVPMDKSFDISSRERAHHLYNKNAELAGRRRRPAQAKIPSDPNAWQQMRENYEAIILGDHAFTEQLEIEYALWQLHYRRIEDLRAQLNASLNSSPADAPQSAKGSTRPSDRISRIRSKFRSFLSEASGFYHDLLLKIRAKHGLPLGYFSDDTGNQIILSEDSNRSAGTKKGLVSCHHCLIYLGDLARYKGMYGEGGSKSRDFTAASSYYIQASSLWPSSGNPHHQLAILASYSGDELEAVYHYFRSLAVDNPFATARDNLVIAFEKNRQRYSQFSGDVKTSAVKSPAIRMTAKGRGKGEAKLFLKDSQPEKASVNEGESSIFETFKTFCVRFVRLNGILFTRTSLEMFDEVFSFALGDFMELLASGPEDGCNFGPNLTENRVAIVRLVAILIFTVHNVNKENDNQSYAEILQRSVLLQNASTSTFKFMSHILERCVQLRDLSISYLLPGVLVFIEWLACHQDIVACCDLEEKQANARLNFWNNCILFLNKILSSGFMSIAEDEDETCFYNMCRYDEEETANRLALWEDFELRGFLPLVPAQLILDFSRKHNFGSEGGRKEVKARLERIVAAGKALANVVQVGKQSIHFDPKLKKFSIGAKPQISEDALISAIEIPSTSGMGQEHVTDRAKNSRETQPKLNMEAEEEDEIIVFKPSVVDKNNDPVAPSTSSDEIFVPDFDASRAEVRSYVGSASSLCNGSILQNASGANITTSELLSSTTRQHLQPFQPSSSKWLVDQQFSLSNGVKDLNLVGNGLVVKPQMQEHLHLQQPTLQLPSSELVPNHSAFSLSSYSVNPNGSTMFTSHAPQFPYMDPLVSSRATFDSFPAKHVPAFPRKNPISRPVRHFGPPPGFNLVPSRDVDECLPDAALEDENMPMDDYSWLDEYHLPLSDKGNGFNNFINRSTQDGCNNLIGHASKNSSSAASVMFPFPGKQVPPFQAQLGNHKKWLDYQIADHLKPFEGHQSQHQNGNQQSILLPEHHEEKSIWEGCSFV